MARPPKPFHLKSHDKKELNQMLSGGIQQVRVVLRALALLQLDSGISAPKVSQAVPFTPQAIRTIAKRYQQHGLERALFERKRKGHAELLDASAKQRIIALVCSLPPEGRARWTVRLVAEEAVKRKLVPGVGRETIRILLESHDLKPWRKKMWCVAELDQEYIAKMEDVLALYEKPYRSAEPVICLDEKPVSLHDDVRPSRPARPGHIAKRDNEYKRCGTANIFAVVEPKAGRHFNCATPNRSAAQFAQVVQRLVAAYPFARKIHLVMDNLNIHCRKSLTDHLGQKQGRYVWSRLKVHYTPKHGSWLNQAEIELSLVSRQCLGTRRIPKLDLLAACLRSWNSKANRDQTCIQWRFTRKAARTRFGYQRNTSTRSQT